MTARAGGTEISDTWRRVLSLVLRNGVWNIFVVLLEIVEIEIQ